MLKFVLWLFFESSFMNQKIELFCALKASFRYMSYLPYLWNATFTNGQIGNIGRLIDKISAKFWEKTYSPIEQKLYKKEIGPTVYGLYETKHLLFS